MPMTFNQIINSRPFMLADGQKKIRMNASRIIESIIIAIVTAIVGVGASAVVTVMLLTERIDAMENRSDDKFSVIKEDIRDLSSDMEGMRSDIYTPVFNRNTNHVN